VDFCQKQKSMEADLCTTLRNSSSKITKKRGRRRNSAGFLLPKKIHGSLLKLKKLFQKNEEL